MKAYLMQHGSPVPKEIDPGRPLSARGISDVKKVAQFLKGTVTEIHKAYHSGKTRSEQTAKVFLSSLGVETELIKRNGLTPLDDIKDIAKELESSNEDIFIAGHMPHLGKLASYLLTGDESKEVVQFQQGGIFCCEKREKGWTVLWMIIPQLISE